MSGAFAAAYAVTNTSPGARTVTGLEFICDSAEYGSRVAGKHTVYKGGQVVQSSGDDFALSGVNSYLVKNLSAVLQPGEVLDIEVSLLFPRNLDPVPAYAPGFSVTSSPADAQPRIRITAQITPGTPGGVGGGGSSGGGTGGTGGMSASEPGTAAGGVYNINSGGRIWARVVRWAYPPSFGIKQLIPPPPPPALFWPTTAGPNYEGVTSGLVITPAVVTGVRHEDGRIEDIEAAGVKFTLGTNDISSTVAVGIHPFKDSGEA